MTKITQQMIDSVEQVLQYNSRYDLDEEAVPELLEQWATAKSRFINKMGGELIKKTDTEVTIERDREELSSIFKEFLSDLGIYIFYQSKIDVEGLREFLAKQGMDAFFENKVYEEQVVNNKVLRKGARISRSLKHFISDGQLLDKIQTKYSMILQDLKITGKLFISVHPLDYLSISETNHNWHSCHSLDGEYAAGNLNYMVDYTTIVVYLATDKEQSIRNFDEVQWYSKKWRMLFYVGEDGNILVGAKNYPFKSQELTNKAFNMVQELFQSSWKSIQEIENKNIAAMLVKDAKQTVHFNDCLLSSSYRGWYTLAEDYDDEIISVGEPVKCLQCNSELILIGGTDFRCTDCSGLVECTCCGYGLDVDETIINHGEFYCEDCAWDVLTYCEGCDRYFNPDIDDIEFYEDEEAYFCADCAEGLEPIELEDECYGR